MKCPHCGANTIVKDSRKTPDGTWRKRHCLSCCADVTTMEQVCVTVKGNRLRAAVDRPSTPKGTKVDRPKRIRPSKESCEAQPTETTRERIERLREEREYEKL